AATELVLDTLQGTPGEIQWPFPKVYREALGGLTTFGYDDTVLLFAPIEVTETSGVVEVSARADFLACETECVPGSVELTRTFPIAHSTRPSSLAERFEQSERRVPVSPRAAGIDAALQVEYETLGPAQTFRAWYELSCEACESLELAAPLTSAFVPYASDRLARSEAQKLYALHPNRVALELASRTGPGTHSAALAGVVGLAIDGDFVAVKLTEPVPRAVSTGSPTLPPYATDAAPASPLSASMSLWQLLLFSFLGGMLLNLMPCVLPVLAIKVVSFTEIARRDRSAIVAHSSAYATAVVGSMLMLALLVVALRAAGTTVGWGFQFQSPLFVSGIGALLVAFSLNLFGVFELSVNATGLSASADSADGLRRSFLEGVLAVLLATPCTAPLLGSAVGFALSQPPWVILLAFFTIGLGLAAPFVILVLAPGASRFLPAPGNWMVTLKQVLGFVLLGSALWLAWVVGRGYGEDAMAATLAFFITVGIAVWLFGRWQLAGPKARWASRGLAVGVLMVAGAVFLRF
ncbi:MAG: cytochrome c biogenesis protein CcdA, partial [Myxococcota bacterium]